MLAFVLGILPWPHIASAVNGEAAVNTEQLLYATFFLSLGVSVKPGHN